jgi:biopolymer transport protein ExbD
LKYIALPFAALAGCQTTPRQVFQLLVTYQPPNSCWITIDGRSYSIWPDHEQSLPALKALHAKSRALLMGPMAVPYKCVGAAIAVSQQAGFKRIGFISEPSPH